MSFWRKAGILEEFASFAMSHFGAGGNIQFGDVCFFRHVAKAGPHTKNHFPSTKSAHKKREGIRSPPLCDSVVAANYLMRLNTF